MRFPFLQFGFALCVSTLLLSCGQSPESPVLVSSTPGNSGRDVHTQSNGDRIPLRHLSLDIRVDFDQRQIEGKARWTLDNPGNQSRLRLDTDGLQIDSVWVDDQKGSFSLDSPVPYLGTALNIPIEAESQSVTIFYRTGPDAAALQWLEPHQTEDKKHPFLYTQSESIYARSWIPCADGPGFRFTFDARVQVPSGLLALMSARNPQEKNDSGLYHFEMEIPIPAYLMALAVGDLEFAPIDKQIGVYAEPGMIQRARWEFEEVGWMMAKAEELYGPYGWGRYDALILPPGFPIGGMENPRLTFCTPTIIAGDRSLMNLVAHELAHSWSGNLVTNATWNDFWLNEGFTVYFERRITESMYGKDYADMLWELGYQDLQQSMELLGHNSPRTHLYQDLENKDPDEGFTDIPYEKGALFLKLIEGEVGRERMDSFLTTYFNEFAFQTIHTRQFLEYLNKKLIGQDEDLRTRLRIPEWVYGPGIPASAPRYPSQRFAQVDSQVKRFLESGAASVQTESWTTHEWLHFLRQLERPLSRERMRDLDSVFSLTQTGNSELADMWFIHSIASRYEEAYPAIDSFLSRVGRRKFIEPLYREMLNRDQGDRARDLYGRYRRNYHPMAQASLDKLFASQEEEI